MRRRHLSRLPVVPLLALLLAACTGTVGGPAVVGAAFATFGSCDELLDYYVGHAVELVGPWGLGYGGYPVPVFEAARAAGEDSAAEPGAEPVFTGTNVQVAGVDEADLVKTDGRRIFTVADGTLRIAVVAPDGVDPAGALPLDVAPQAMLLHGDTVVLLGSGYGSVIPMGDAPARELAPDMMPVPGSATTRIVEVDVADPASPRVVATLDLDGSYVNARLVGDVMRVAVNSSPVGFAWQTPAGSGLLAEREATEANRALVRASTIDNWLPYSSLAGVESREGPLVDCTKVMAPTTFSGLDTLSLLAFDLTGGIGEWTSAGVVAAGSTMYATADRTYISTSPWADWSDPAEAARGHRTPVHLFTTAGTDLRYVGSGAVDGFLLNQFAMDELATDAGTFLRVASTSTPAEWWAPGESESHVTVLRVDPDALTETGRVSGLGKGEQIRSVRFLGTRGYVVTFRQTDPLYVVDLADPAAPRVAGELKIPGYSAYLHPVSDTRLLGIGQDADSEGRVRGTQVSLFDVSDPAAPVRVDQVGLEGGWSAAETDHHAFTFFGDLAFAPYEVWDWPAEPAAGPEGGYGRYDAGVLAVRVGADGLSLDTILRPVADGPVVDKGAGAYPGGGAPLRTIVIDGRIYTVTYGGIAVHDLATFSRLGFFPF